MFCPRCGVRQPEDHRFCVGCGALLPRELPADRRPKVSRWFFGIPVVPTDPPWSMLRVSRYLEEFEITSPEGSVRVPSHHVRFSIWKDDRAVATVSIPDDEARELAGFLLVAVPDGEPVAG
jgi:hypothetical protein